MTEIYAVFKKFTDLDQAKELAFVLEAHGIDYKFVDNSPSFDVAFSGNSFQKEVQVKIKQNDFERANKMLEENAMALLNEVDKDHYLFEFTNDELYDLLMKPDEWGTLDFMLAQKILQDRGQEINDDLIQSFKKQRLEELSKLEKGQKPWIIAGFLKTVVPFLKKIRARPH